MRLTILDFQAPASVVSVEGMLEDQVKIDPRRAGVRQFDALGLASGISGLKAGVGAENPIPPPPPPPPGPPELPPSGSTDFSLCMDLMVVIDVSCSITMETRKQAREAAADLVRRVLKTPGGSVRVGLIVYSSTTSHTFHLNDLENIDEIINAIETVELEAHNCKTHTHLALKELKEISFTEKNGDRKGIQNVALLFTDGRTVSGKFRDDTVKAATALKEAGIELNIIGVANRKFKPDVGEFDMVPDTPTSKHFFNLTDATLQDDIIRSLSDRYICNSGDPFQGCVDIAFAFDFSCSIDIDQRNIAVDIAKRITELASIRQENGAILTAFSFDTKIGNEVPFYSTESPSGFLSSLDSMNKSGFGCRTKTYDAFIKAETIFNTDLDRDDATYPDVLFVFGDGLTAPAHRKEATIAQAKSLTSNTGVQIVWLVMPNNRKKDGLDEIEAIASTVETFGQMIFDVGKTKTNQIVDELSFWLGRDFPCPEVGER
ncbi:unnamed protein product [Owenia fusiformis]|uniref:Uncharacterized protein n=1 Tax=Owenia fusiformis TaxID=6347 RepID=A0A8J1TLG7_OWEFU|nr:unnamed protein product [Owenia fusiformis]